jgi:SAM-dependent methyltransferase
MFKHDERILPHLYYKDFYPTYANFLGRYAFASKFVGPEATVLDLACGCGYGTAHLAEAPRRLVIGLDQSVEATEYGRDHYASSRLRFLRGSATDLPFQSQSVDAVVALEMIEHVQDDKGVLAEAYRLLKPGGVCVLSTPNRLVTGTVDKPSNPYHVREYTPDEFRALLRQSFCEFSLYGQDLTPASQVCTENMARIWHNLSLLHDQCHATRSRLELDERFTGLSLLRRLKRVLGGEKKPSQTPGQALLQPLFQLNRMDDWDITPYGVERAPIIMAVCRK